MNDICYSQYGLYGVNLWHSSKTGNIVRKNKTKLTWQKQSDTCLLKSVVWVDGCGSCRSSIDCLEYFDAISGSGTGSNSNSWVSVHVCTKNH